MLPYDADFGPFSTSMALPTWVLDKKEEARIRHRRRVLEERAKRIHQPRVTSIAVDVVALGNQVKDKKALMQKEIRRNKDYAEMAETLDKFNLRQAHLTQKEKEATQKELCRFWKEDQPPEKRREYDLNSNQHQRDSGYEISFVGEDEGLKEREAAQKKQMKELLQRQIEDEKRRDQMEENRRREEIETSVALSERAKRIAETEELCRKAEQLALFTLNQSLTREKKDQQERQRREEEEATRSQIHHAIHSTLLTEDERVARSVFGPHRVLCDRWKGMNEDQKQAYHLDLMDQIAENKSRRECHASVERDYEGLAMRAAQVATRQQLDEEESKKKSIKELELENATLAEKQRRQRKIHDVETATNIVTDDFFDKFGIYPR